MEKKEWKTIKVVSPPNKVEYIEEIIKLIIKNNKTLSENFSSQENFDKIFSDENDEALKEAFNELTSKIRKMEEILLKF